MPLGRVAVAVGAEDHDDPAARDLAYGGKSVEEGIRAVTEVDVHGGSGVAADELGPAWQVRVDALVDGLTDGFELEACLDEHHDGEARIRCHVPADEGHATDERAALRPGETKLGVRGLLVENLESLVDAWAPNDPNNYRAQFLAEDPAVALGQLMSGMIILSGFETGGERLQAALDSGDQEEEHSCFSDNTHRDMVQDVQGIQNVWLGSYESLDGATVSGPSIQGVIAAGDAALADQLTTRIAESTATARCRAACSSSAPSRADGPAHRS